MPEPSSVPRIGFACVWDQPNPQATWSFTPWNLRAAMRSVTDVPDVGVSIPRQAQMALKALHTRRRGGRMVTTWRQSSLTDAYIERAVNGAVAKADCDAVFEIGDLASLQRPFFLYQDLSFDALLAVRESAGVPLPLNLTPSDLRRRRERQLTVYAKAAGVFAMSHWFARTLVELTGLPEKKVHVLHPGRSAVATRSDSAPLPVREGPRRRLLMVGQLFLQKGGQQVLGALEILRRDVDPDITLTVAGPPQWPLPGEIPAGVEYLGRRPREEIGPLYDSHDLFVMPSRLDGFGIVFTEALSRGMPCIGRDAFAMPEIIEPGVTGALITGDDPADLAAVIAGALADDSLYAKCRAKAPEIAAHFTWERAGRQVVDTIAIALAA
jgi:glycosyltransferase involved in cell wall biosynthesis